MPCYECEQYTCEDAECECYCHEKDWITQPIDELSTDYELDAE